MSYDLMVLDKHKRFERKEDFLNWYNKVTEWEDDLDYNDYKHATPELQEWFLDMKDTFPPMNGEFAPSDDEVDEGEHYMCDYCIAKDAIYCAFAWSDAEDAYKLSQEKAKTHDVAFFDVESGLVYYPDGYVMNLADETKASNEKIQESSTKAQTSSSYQKYNFGEKYEVKFVRGMIGIGIILFFAVLISIGVALDDSIEPWASACIIAAIIIVSLSLMYCQKRFMKKDYLYLDCEGVHVNIKNRHTNKRDEGCILWKNIAKFERVEARREILNVYFKNGNFVSYDLSFFYFSKKRFFAAVDYYSSMANARVGNNDSFCIEKSSRTDWKSIGIMALGMLCAGLLKLLLKYVFS